MGKLNNDMNFEDMIKNFDPARHPHDNREGDLLNAKAMQEIAKIANCLNGTIGQTNKKLAQAAEKIEKVINNASSSQDATQKKISASQNWLTGMLVIVAVVQVLVFAWISWSNSKTQEDIASANKEMVVQITKIQKAISADINALRRDIKDWGQEPWGKNWGSVSDGEN